MTAEVLAGLPAFAPSQSVAPQSTLYLWDDHTVTSDVLGMHVVFHATSSDWLEYCADALGPDPRLLDDDWSERAGISANTNT